MNEHKDCEKNYRELVDKLGVVLNLPTVKESGMISVEDIRKLIPELAKSEDERIINNIKKVIGWYRGMFTEKSLMPEEYQEIDAWLEKRAEQKTTDKVEPKFKVGDVMRTLEEAQDGITDGLPIVVSVDERNYHCTNELISIKDQDEYEYPPKNRKQESAEWSDEDEKNFTNISDLISDFYRPERASVLSTWFDGLKERVLSQPNKVWSDEDKKRINQICEDLRCGLKNFEANKNVKGLHCRETIESNIDWMRNTLSKHQCRWKLTEEQIKALDFYLKDDIDKEGVFGKRIVELYNDLKKLKD